MGLLGNLFGGLLGAGAGVAGAHNAHLAELAIKKLSPEERKRVANKAIDIGVQASGNRMNAEQFCNHFNRKERLCQLNVIALALNDLNIHEVRGDSWMEVRNPFMLNISDSDLRVNSDYLFKKHKLRVSIGTGSVNIKEWFGQESSLIA